MSDTPKRVPVPKRVRFEVFKRDGFACQYCGAKAPDVVLQVDHIKAVATGGDNDILNLVTACVACNAGKGARALDDNTAIERQRTQIEELNERREQLEMMIEWREGLRDIGDQEVRAFEDRFQADTDRTLTDKGRQDVRKWVREYGLSAVLDTWDVSRDQYLSWVDGKLDIDSVGKAFSYVPRILRNKKRMEAKPYLRDLFYIRGILRNRLAYVNEAQCMTLLERAHLAGATIDSLRSLAASVRNWTNFASELNEFLDEHEQ